MCVCGGDRNLGILVLFLKNVGEVLETLSSPIL